MQYLEPLINAKVISINGLGYDFTNQNAPLNRIFPAMQSFMISSFYKTSEFLDHVFINLQHFEVFSTMQALEHFTPMLTKNQQIRSFKAGIIEHEDLRTINSLLPNLEILDMGWYRFGPGTIRIENVRELRTSPGENSPVNLFFPHLEKLHLSSTYTPHLRLWIDFLNRHQHMDEFHLVFNHFDFADDFLGFLEQTTNLVEMTLWLPTNYSPRITSAFCTESIMESLAQLDKLSVFHLFTYDKNHRKLAQEKCGNLDNKWHITNGEKGLTFKRK